MEKNIKAYRSPGYNTYFNIKTGVFVRWGKTLHDDPEFSPVGPEILDLEASSVCTQGCSWCYKSNTYKGKNMSFETFKAILDKMPPTLTQVAFGIGNIDANLDLWKMMEYCREKNVVPNITINGSRMTSELYDKLSKYCGAVAVSDYDKDVCYNTVKELTDRGMTQVNIHCLLAHESSDKCIEVLLDSQRDSRLKSLNAIVYLWLKPKGNRNYFTQVRKEEYKELINLALEKKVRFGFDSCSAPMFLDAVKGHKDYKQFEMMAEPCESFGLFSSYINAEGRYFPCSFAEGVGEWKEGIDVANCDDFLGDVWNHPLLEKYRQRSIAEKDCNGCRKCLLYDLGVS